MFRKLASGLSSSFLALILMGGLFKDFRSVGLVGSICKLIVKVLVGRLGKIVNEGVGGMQQAFVGGQKS